MSKKYVVYIVMGGSGIDIKEMDANAEWTLGAGEELIGYADSEEEANKLADEYLERLG